MDFEFDKEIDILLRQGRKGEALFTVTTSQTAHLNADEISAFAENALPEKAKQHYTAHLADCNSCRKSLSELIFLNAEDEKIQSSKNIVVASPAIPWYRRIFAIPNLAYTFGALIVLFGGITGFTILQNLNIPQTSEVAKINEKPQVIERMAPESVTGILESNSSANTNTTANLSSGTIYDSNSMMSSAAVNSNTSVVPTKPVPSPAEPKNAEPERENDLTAVKKEENNFSLESAVENPLNQNSIQDVTAGRRNQRAQEDAKDKSSTPQIPASPNSSTSDRQISALPVQNRRNDTVLSSPAPKIEPKKAKTSGVTENETTTVGGKNFDRRNNVWYDANYKQQPTINITRGTEKYKKLDRGLRSIVENLGGTVVIVWKEKAYRIQ